MKINCVSLRILSSVTCASVMASSVASAAPELSRTGVYRTQRTMAVYRRARESGNQGYIFASSTFVASNSLSTASGLSIGGLFGAVGIGFAFTLTAGQSIMRWIDGTSATVSTPVRLADASSLPSSDQACLDQFNQALPALLADTGVSDAMQAKGITQVAASMISVDRANYRGYDTKTGSFQIRHADYLPRLIEEISMGRKRSFKNLVAVVASRSDAQLSLSAYALAPDAQTGQGGECLIPSTEQIKMAL